MVILEKEKGLKQMVLKKGQQTTAHWLAHL